MVENGKSLGELLAQETEKAKRWSELGIYQAFDPCEFPNLSKDQKRFADFKLFAVRTLYYDKNSARNFVRNDPDAFARISLEMIDLVKLAATIVKEAYPENTSSDGEPSIFWMNPEEKASFETAISLGLSDSINAINFPSLAAVRREDLLRFKLRAMDNKISELEHLGLKTKEVGFLTAVKGNTNVLDVAKKEREEVRKLLGLS